MAGIKIVTNVDPEQGLQLAWRAAQDLGFTLTAIEGSTFEASKGNAILSMLAGIIAPHCHFKVSAKRYEDGSTDLVLERNSAWTSGLLGKRHIKGEADALMTRVAESLEKSGSKVVERREI